MDKLNQDTPIEENKEEVDTPDEGSIDETNETVKEFLGEDVTEEVVEEPTDTKTEEKPAETIVEEVETPKEPEVPLEEVIEEVKAKTKEETKQEILKALGMSEEEKVVAEEQGYKFPWEKRNEDAPKNWKEVVDASIEYQTFKKDEEQKILAEDDKKKLAVMQEREAQINTEWDSQLAYLRNEGLVPEIAPEIQKKLNDGKILTKAEREDRGLKVQADIFNKMYEVSQDREKKGLPPITDVIHVYSRYYKAPVQAGKDAPVSGGNVPISSGEGEDISYEQLRNSSFTDLVN